LFFGSNHKVSHGLDPIQTMDIDVAAIHNDVGTGLKNNLIEHSNIVNLSVRNIDNLAGFPDAAS
jgi:hypothetical protein